MRYRIYYVYILASLSRRLYIGVTNNLERRLYEHRHPVGNTFASRYRITRLVHFEEYGYVLDAIAREKQLKRWSRTKKICLVERHNPGWHDLGESWF